MGLFDRYPKSETVTPEAAAVGSNVDPQDLPAAGGAPSQPSPKKHRRFDWVNAVLVAILVLGAIFRFSNLRWDDGQNFHPDERFVTQVAIGLQWPSSIGEYFNSQASPLNPCNHDSGCYIYGTFPLFLQKAMASLVGRDYYDGFAPVARFASALFDLMTVLLVYLIGRRLFDRRIGLLASFLLACAVLPIQLSHFGTSDTFMSTLVLATFFFILRADAKGKWYDYALAGACAGLALASKLSALPAFAFLALPLLEQMRTQGVSSVFTRRPGRSLMPILGVMLAGVAAVWAFRIGQPYSFSGTSIFDFHLDQRWIDLVKSQQGISSGRAPVPYTVQWAGRIPVLFHLQNLMQWGLGWPLGITAIVAALLGVLRMVTARNWPPTWQVILVGWPLFTIVYNGLGFMQYLRYSLPAYPFLAILAAALLYGMWRVASTKKLAISRGLLRAPLVIVPLLTLLYALAFMHIYQQPVTRITASVWIFDNIPAGSTITFNEWDDPVPVGIPGRDGGAYTVFPMRPYIEENPEKVNEYVNNLITTDYIGESSNRIYGSVPRIPEQYPMITRYYEMLFSGELGFELVADFTEHPQLFGFELNDDGAEESFTVYDHPRVLIWKKTDKFDPEYVRQQLTAALDSVPMVLQVGPLNTGKNYLMFDEAEMAVQQSGGTWSEIFDRGSITNRYPAIAWYLALQAIALVALPLGWRLLRRLPDRGYAVSKTIGLLGVAWISWLLASTHLVEFGRVSVLLGMGVIAALSALAVGGRWKTFLAEMSANRKLIIAAELVFLGAFALFTWFRWINPDLWHPARGGEKPMEFAYFNAVIRSTHFPAYDPWFAGGYLNYYYFGYVIYASVVRLTGIIPQVAFNLAVATGFALTALNAWSFVTNVVSMLSRKLRIRSAWTPILLGLLGSFLVVFMGNLDMARRIGIGEMGYMPPPSGGGFLGQFGDVVRGTWRAFTDFHTLPTDAFWAPTRVIDGAINEFPYWSFLFADLHAHMMAIPFTMAMMVIALGILALHRWPDAEPAPPETGTPFFGLTPGWRDRLRSLPFGLTAERVGIVLLAALFIGAAYPMNAWDYPTYILVSVTAFLVLELLGSALEPGHGWRFDWQAVRRAGAMAVGVVVLGRVYFLPYFQGYLVPNSGFDRWLQPRTFTWQYLDIHGTLLFFIVTLFVLQLYFSWGKTRAIPDSHDVRAAGGPVPYASGLVASASDAQQRLRFNPVLIPLVGLALIAYVGFQQNQVLVLIGSLVLLTAMAAWDKRDDPLRLFLTCLAGLALLITAAVEVYTLRGDIGRMNTVFKFYLQVWMMLSLVAAVGLVIIVARYLPRFSIPFRVGWGVLAVLLVLAGFVFPLRATEARLNDRFERNDYHESCKPHGLDGMAYMDCAVVAETPEGRETRVFPLEPDHKAIVWLQDNVQGSPVIVEAWAPNYRWGTRIANNTGLPTVIGWDWHQVQQRPGYGQMIEARKADVAQIYTSTAPFAETRPILDRYGVRYIYVGEMERAYYGEDGLQKFRDAAASGELLVAYDADGVTIYEVPQMVTEEIAPNG